MPNLKDLKVRINSVKSTQKITSAMKMVAAAKLKRAQEGAEAARPYAERMENVVSAVATSTQAGSGAPKMLTGDGKDDVHLLVVCTSDRGLCGGFNGSIIRHVRKMATDLISNGKQVKLLFVGRKGHDVLKREFAANIVDAITGIGRKNLEYGETAAIAKNISERYNAGEFDVCTIVFNRFQSAMTQIVTQQQLIPFSQDEELLDRMNGGEGSETVKKSDDSVYIFEPEEQDILTELLPRNLSIQVYQALLENAASEHGARMTAMDSATRNAGDMIDGLTLTYNRTRQAFITKELIEIISGAEAL